jgi:hypothetical protein
MNEIKIPNFITAKNPEELRILMFQKQVELSRKLHFFDINPYKGGFIAWYEVSTTVESFSG